MSPYSALHAAADLGAAGLARLFESSPAALRALRALPVPAKSLLARRIRTETLPPNGRTRVGRLRFDLDFADPLDRTVYFNCYERKSLRLARGLTPEGGVVLDVGANIGTFTIPLALAAGPAGRVHAFEPEPGNFSRLTGHCQLNGVSDRVQLAQSALSDREGEATLRGIESGSAYGTLAGFGAGWPIAHRVRTVTVDGYLEAQGIDRVHLAKIDVEGHEFRVLAGARRALSRQSIDNVLIEYNGLRLSEEGHSLVEFLDLFAGFGYEPAAFNRRWLAAMRRGLLNPADICLNLLFVPSRRSNLLPE